MNSGLSLVDDSTPCACRSSYMNTGKCCLSQWWIIGLASAAGAVVLVAFIAGVGCCCSYKAKAKRATKDAQTAQQLSRKLQDDLDRMESEVIERSVPWRLLYNQRIHFRSSAKLLRHCYLQYLKVP